MATAIANYGEGVNFWKINPQYKLLGLFANLHRRDTSKDKGYSSKIMWAILFFADMTKDNSFRNFPEDERKSLIKDEFMSGTKFNWKDNQNLVDFYIQTQTTQQKRSLMMLKRKMEEREAFLDKSKYTITNAKELDSIIANTEKLFSLLNKLEESIRKEEETDSGQVRGGRTESAGELKQI